MTVVDRFWEKVNRLDGADACWEWTGAIDKSSGYGAFKVGGRRVTPHRLSLSWKLGRDVGPHLDACHTCDNRRCVRPDHLYEGTRKQNVGDCVSRGRHARGETVGTAKLTEAEIVAIKASALDARALSRRFSVHPTTVRAIRGGRSWRHAA